MRPKARATDLKAAFYGTAQRRLLECNEAVHMGGDFNARLQHRHDNATEIMGPILSGGAEILYYTAEGTHNSICFA